VGEDVRPGLHAARTTAIRTIASAFFNVAPGNKKAAFRPPVSS
jgi:hypothetical protein